MCTDALMTGPIAFAFRVFDALLGIVFMAALSLGAIGLFVLGGAPKQYEIDAMGGAYVGVLETVEGAARELKEDYCASAGGAARRDGRCSSAAYGAGTAR